jgi:hypothetical protein
MASDFAMSRPEFAPERREIWFTDGPSGFYVLRLDTSAWPSAASPRLSLSEVAKRGRHATRVHVLVTIDHEGEGPMPVPRVTVTIGGHRVHTDAHGQASILVNASKPRTLRLLVAEVGYQAASGRVRVGP